VEFKDCIIRESPYWIVVNKPVNISVQPDKTGDPSIVDLASKYLGKETFVINRIDRPVSGLVIIGKSAQAQEAFRELFATRKIKKYYLAVTQNKPPLERDKLHHLIKKNSKKNKSFIYTEKEEGVKDAYLVYEYLKSINKYHILKIRLITGRHHQIRAQLAHIDCPIRGDIKYGYSRANRVHSIQLHSWKLYFKDPWTNEHIWLYADPPKENIWQAFDVHGIQEEELKRYGRTK